jgi:mono/diheme cytochrome c family protein
MSAHSRPIGVLLGGLWMTAIVSAWGGQGAAAAAPALQDRSETSPASERPPQTRTPQEYPPEQIAAGRAQFAAECGFCHGRDAAGGTGGTDLTRSLLVAEDVRGDRLGPAIRSGRPGQGMPAFALPDDDLAAIVAYIHDQKRRGDSAIGGRRSVEAADLQSGNAAAGKRYFEAACATCHAATGDLAGVATRFEGPALLQRMLYPRSAVGWAGADYTVYGRGVLRAIEYETGRIRWSHDLSGGAGAAGVLTTASGLTFTGDSATSALALRTGDGTTLWHAGIGRMGNSPVTYALDGRQYVLFGGGGVLYAWMLPA